MAEFDAWIMIFDDFEQLLKDWQIAMIAQALSETTQDERIRCVRAFSKAIEHSALEADSVDIVRWLATKPTAITRWTYYTHLKAFYRWAVLSRRLVENPMLAIPAPKRPTYKPRPVPLERIQTVLEGRLHFRTRMMIMLAYHAGLRVHEIAKIRGQDYDRERGALTVLGKGNQLATVFLPPVLQELCKKMPLHGWWFPSYVKKGEHILPQSVNSTIQQAFARYGWKITAHQLRHSTGTELVRAHVDIRIVQEVLRHKSLQSTQIYTQVNDDQIREAVLRLPVFTEKEDPAEEESEGVEEE